MTYQLSEDPEEAAIMLMAAQLARVYLDAFRTPYPLTGTGELQCLYELMERNTHKRQYATAKIVRLWKQYLNKVGPSGSLRGFEQWEARRRSNVVRFPDAATP